MLLIKRKKIRKMEITMTRWIVTKRCYDNGDVINAKNFIFSNRKDADSFMLANTDFNQIYEQHTECTIHMQK